MIEEEMSKIDERGLEKLGTLQSSEKTIAILGGRWWSQTSKTGRGWYEQKRF